MIELRWKLYMSTVNPNPSEYMVLQYRTYGLVWEKDSRGVMTDHDGWSEWKDVPEVEED